MLPEPAKLKDNEIQQLIIGPIFAKLKGRDAALFFDALKATQDFLPRLNNEAVNTISTHLLTCYDQGHFNDLITDFLSPLIIADRVSESFKKALRALPGSSKEIKMLKTLLSQWQAVKELTTNFSPIKGLKS